jgi:hypothetical protein
MEEWKELPGYNKRYWISNQGRVKSFAWGKEHILSPGTQSDGYLTIAPRKNGQAKYYLVHRLVLMLFYGPPPEGYHANHKDGNKMNNSIDNLEWVTCLDNSRHAWHNGLMNPSRGEKHGMSKLTKTEVKEIRALLCQKVPHRKIANRFGVSKSCITHISIGTTWQHL